MTRAGNTNPFGLIISRTATHAHVSSLPLFQNRVRVEPIYPIHVFVLFESGKVMFSLFDFLPPPSSGCRNGSKSKDWVFYFLLPLWNQLFIQTIERARRC